MTNTTRNRFWKEKKCVDNNCIVCKPYHLNVNWADSALPSIDDDKLNFFGIFNFIVKYVLYLSIIAIILYLYIYYTNFITNTYIGFGFYGLFLVIYIIIQCVSSQLNRFKHAKIVSKRPSRYDHVNIGVQISAYKEDPVYLKKCLEGLRDVNYNHQNLYIALCIDGNSDDDVYQSDIFKSVFPDSDIIKKNSNGFGQYTAVDYQNLQKFKQNVCINQAWGGKRSVMSIGFEYLLSKDVEYILCTDSDTIFDPNGLQDLVYIIHSEKTIGAIGGNVKILEKTNSYMTYLSALRYSVAFHIERGAQSYFGCVSCISGPYGLYKASALNHILKRWGKQYFLGQFTSFGDDRHLSNRIIQLGYKTKFYDYAKCYTETPDKVGRWLSQQIRWSKSYVRELMYNMLWCYKQSWYMILELALHPTFTILVAVTMVRLMFSGRLWDGIWLLVLLYTVAFIKVLVYSIVLKQNLMVLSSYAPYYMFMLLPCKFYAAIRMNATKWGTSNRLNKKINNEGFIPVVIWCAVLLSGAIYSTVKNVQNTFSKNDMYYCCFGTLYLSLFISIPRLVFIHVRSIQKKKNIQVNKVA